MMKRGDATTGGALAAGGGLAAPAKHECGGPGGEPVAASPGGLVDQKRMGHAALFVGRTERRHRSGEPGGGGCGGAQPLDSLARIAATCCCTSFSGAVASTTWMRAPSRRASAR